MTTALWYIGAGGIIILMTRYVGRRIADDIIDAIRDGLERERKRMQGER